MLPFKKIYIDSRFRTPDSVSASNFKVELPYTLHMPENTVFFVTDVCIPNVWRTIEENVNDRIYIRYNTPEGALPVQQVILTSKYRLIKLTSQNYSGQTLATEIQNQLNSISDSFISFSVSYDTTQY